MYTCIVVISYVRAWAGVHSVNYNLYTMYLGSSATVLLSCPPSIPKNLLLMELILRRTDRLLISCGPAGRGGDIQHM